MLSEQTISEQIIQLHQAGYSIREIAAQLQVTKYTVEKALKKKENVAESQSDNLYEATNTSSRHVLGATAASQTPVNQTATEEFLTQLHNHQMQMMRQSQLSSFKSSYRDFLYGMKTFLSESIVSVNYAPKAIAHKRDHIDYLISNAKQTCAKLQLPYSNLFVAYTLDRLYLYLNKTPKLYKKNYSLYLEEDPAITLLLTKALKSEIEEPTENYARYFPDIM